MDDEQFKRFMAVLEAINGNLEDILEETIQTRVLVRDIYTEGAG